MLLVLELVRVKILQAASYCGDNGRERPARRRIYKTRHIEPIVMAAWLAGLQGKQLVINLPC